MNIKYNMIINFIWGGIDVLKNEENLLLIKERLENLREKLNDDAVKNIECNREKENESLLVISRELDDVIIDYIKNYI